MARILLAGSLILAFVFSSTAQSQVTGYITDDLGEPLIGATVKIEGTAIGSVTGTDGFYRLGSIPAGSYTMVASFIGLKTVKKDITLEKPGRLSIDFQLKEAISELDEILIVGKTESTELSEQPMTINSLDTKPVLAQALGAEELLKTSTGVVVRQSGGLGSNVNINLNGLSGEAVRIYFDGIPIDVFGGGLQLNTIPIDALDRVDVYKGVMPIAIGTDALGGGINLVPAKKDFDYLRASYTFGSFNTHRFALGANKNLSDKLSVSTLSYFNYSDNNYKMRNTRSVTEQTLPNGSVVAGPEEIIDVERFHDRHISGYIEAAVKLKNVSWADQLDFATSCAHRDDQVQHGAFIFNTAVGEAEFQIGTFAQRLDYRKRLFKEKLDLRYYGVLSLSQNEVQDSTRFRYNWRGERLQTGNQRGSELFSIPTRREGDDLGTAHRLVLNYKINEQLGLSVSEFYRYTRIQGEDPVGARITVDEEEIDPNTIPSTLNRNILGAELTGTFLKKKLTPVVFYKNYYYNAESIDILQTTATRLPVREVRATDHGYGLAIKYEITPALFVRSSFEQAVRIPTEMEIFGDFGAILPNYELRPEKSRNYNLGVNYSTFLTDARELFIRVDAFARDQQDLVRPTPFGPENIRFINEAEVDGMGVEVASRFSPVRKLNLSGNFTYQSSELVTSGNQEPNVPTLFYNLGARYTFESIFGSYNSLEISWNYFFIDRFSINEVQDLDGANPAFIIPAQNVHNAGLIYRLEKGMDLSFNLQNVFNTEVFDNFRVPRPGINYQFKINYSL